jgi:hypothetical protein
VDALGVTDAVDVPSDPFGFDALTDPRELVFQALGAASACWENLAGAGVFDSTRAKEVGDALLARLAQLNYLTLED